MCHEKPHYRANLERAKETITAISASELQQQKDELLNLIQRSHEVRIKDRCIAHFDLDYFFVQAELLRSPDLRKVPVAVGSDRMLSTSNYVARQLGIHGGMAGHVAKRLCPELIIKEHNFELYDKISSIFHSCVAEFGDSFMITGADECYVDLTRELANMKDSRCYSFVATMGECQCILPSLRNVFINSNFMTVTRYPFPPETCPKCKNSRTRIGLEIRYDPTIEGLLSLIRHFILVRTGLTCSAGVAPTFPLAKIVAGMKKPNNQYILSESDMDEFIKNIKLSKLGGFGETICATLGAFNIETIQDAYNNLGMLKSLVSDSQLEPILAILCGMDASPVFETVDESGVVLKNPFGKPPELNLDESTVGAERTFTVTDDHSKLLQYLDAVIDEAMIAAQESGRAASSLYLKVRFADFKISTSSALTPALNLTSKPQISSIAQKLFSKYGKRKIRLLGVRFVICHNKNVLIQKILNFKRIEKTPTDEHDSDVEIVNVKKTPKPKTSPKLAHAKTPELNQIKKYLKPTPSPTLPDDDIFVLKEVEVRKARSETNRTTPVAKNLPSDTPKRTNTKRHRVINENKTPAKKLVKNGDLTPFIKRTSFCCVDVDSDIEVI